MKNIKIFVKKFEDDCLPDSLWDLDEFTDMLGMRLNNEAHDVKVLEDYEVFSIELAIPTTIYERKYLGLGEYMHGSRLFVSHFGFIGSSYDKYFRIGKSPLEKFVEKYPAFCNDCYVRG